MINLQHNAIHGKKAKWQKWAGFFRQELVMWGIISTYDAVDSGYRIATSRTGYWLNEDTFMMRAHRIYQPVHVGDLAYVTRNTHDFPSVQIPVRIGLISRFTVGRLIEVNPAYRKIWSLAQGWREDYLDSNPAVLAKYDLYFTVETFDSQQERSEVWEEVSQLLLKYFSPIDKYFQTEN